MVLQSFIRGCVLYEVEEVTTDPSCVAKHMNQVGEVIKLSKEEFKNAQRQYRGPSGHLKTDVERYVPNWCS